MLSARAVEAPQAAATSAAAARLVSAMRRRRWDRSFIGRVPFSDDRGSVDADEGDVDGCSGRARSGRSEVALAVDSDGTVVWEQRPRLNGSIDLHREVEASPSERRRQRQGGPVTVTR